ncbi:MAG: hypothetical protein SFV54_11640 [Bryobacteraceae bacterium]|nr:hypothetical protein [Bryobacteraceae bacterium]
MGFQAPARRAAYFLFAAGFAMRLAMLWFGGIAPLGVVEPANLALSLVESGSYADAYGVGSGPSAHTMPGHPLLIAGLVRVFGREVGMGAALAVTASAAAALAYALLPLMSAGAGLGWRVGAFAGLAGELLPVNFWPQTRGVFDAPFTLLALTALVTALARPWSKGYLTGWRAAGVGLMAAAGILFSAHVVAVVGSWLVAAWLLFRGDFRSWARGLAIIGGLMGVVLLVWAARNERALGKWVMTRSNFGLELHVSNNDAASADGEANLRNPAWGRLHPSINGTQLAALRRLGEVEYHARKRQEAMTWIREHPMTFVRLTAERAVLFWFPVMRRPWQTAVQALLMVLALVGVRLLWRRNRAFGWLLAASCVSYSLVYLVVQVTPRYRLPIEGLLLLVAAMGVQRLVQLLGSRVKAV